MIPVPSVHFADPPYKAELFNPKTGWAGVLNMNGFNCLSSSDKPGAVITSWNHALRIAETWNKAETKYQSK